MKKVHAPSRARLGLITTAYLSILKYKQAASNKLLLLVDGQLGGLRMAGNFASIFLQNI
jgi:hypothetical protein